MLALDDDDLLASVRRLNPDPLQRGRYPLLDVFARNVRALAELEQTRTPLRFAYSVKTNPAREALELVRDAGLYAEVISEEELAYSLELGFSNRTIYNGPQPAWRTGNAPGIAFADSIEAYIENGRHLEGTLSGVRARPATIRSRFGVGFDRLSDLCKAIRLLGRRTIGVSMHVRPEDLGEPGWRGAVSSAMEFAVTIERRTNARVTAFDVGGGKTPVEFDRSVASGDLAWLLRETCAQLPSAHAVFSEPGQAVATPAAIFVAPVLEIRRIDGATEVVIDAGYPDLPQISTFRHRILAIVDDEIELLAPGSDRILGRTCLEYDIVREDVRLPSRLDALRAIIVADAGAYDASMSFEFAQGGNTSADDRAGISAR